MPSLNNNQREGSTSNAHVGRDFEILANQYFKNKGIILSKNYKIEIGINSKKIHAFDLGNDDMLIECKSYRWTNSDITPSAKITSLNQAMYYFYLAPNKYKKILFISMSYSQKRCKTLVEYYIEKNFHLIPQNVEIIEYNEESENVELYKFDELIMQHNRIV